MYVSLVFQAVFIGYSVGTAPIVSYQYGAGNHRELKGLLKKSFVLVGVFAVIMFAAALALARPLSFLFVGYDEELLELTVHAF
ncbi:MATE family efflux transporter, partial [Bacillus safensis]